MRDRDKIKADLELVQTRLAANRKRVRDEEGRLPPGDFNKITDQISTDVAQLETLLAELFDAMCLDSPENLVK